jgi:hypothetical protein
MKTKRLSLTLLALLSSFIYIGVSGFYPYNANAATLALTWDEGSDLNLAGYNVYYATHSLLGLVPVEAVKMTSVRSQSIGLDAWKSQKNSFVIYTLSEQTPYFFRITAFNLLGKESDFNIDSASLAEAEVSAVTPSAPVIETHVSAVLDPLDESMAIVAVKTTDPAFSAMTVRAQLEFDSGKRDLTLTAITGDPTVFIAKISTSLLAPSDFLPPTDSKMKILVGGQTLVADKEIGMIFPDLGGRVKEENGLAEVVINPGMLDQEITLKIYPETSDMAGVRNTALKRQNLKSLGLGREFTIDNPQAMKNAIITIPFDRSQIPSGRDLTHIRIAYFNSDTRSWELQSNTKVIQDRAESAVSHFSFYMPVLVMPSAEAAMRDSCAYPNPAIDSEEPTIRVMLGQVDSLDISIFDLSGQKVHSASLSGEPTGIYNGEYFYDYLWQGPKSSGVYFAVVHGKTGNDIVRAKIKFAVIR